jgi:APA family basic amino acid/polyamine antiporter
LAVPERTLTVIDAVGIIVGIVVGAGIFKTPSIVAANAGVVLVMGALVMLVAESRGTGPQRRDE